MKRDAFVTHIVIITVICTPRASGASFDCLRSANQDPFVLFLFNPNKLCSLDEMKLNAFLRLSTYKKITVDLNFNILKAKTRGKR